METLRHRAKSEQSLHFSRRNNLGHLAGPLKETCSHGAIGVEI